MDIKSKLEGFKGSIEDDSNREYRQIEQDVENEINSGIEREVLEYENKKKLIYDKNVQKIEKEFNKKVFNYEIECKKYIIDEEKRLKKAIKDEAIEILKDYTENDNYLVFLNKCINERNVTD